MLSGEVDVWHFLRNGLSTTFFSVCVGSRWDLTQNPGQGFFGTSTSLRLEHQHCQFFTGKEIVMKSQKKLGAAWTPRGMLSGEVDVWHFLRNGLSTTFFPFVSDHGGI